MALIGQMSFGKDYATAERFADEWAGDNHERAAVVENLEDGFLLVMDYGAAESYLTERDAVIQYDADHRCPDPACRAQGCPEHPRHDGPDHTYEQHHSRADHVGRGPCRCDVYT